ncbi:MAG: membrane protein insertase YidC [Pseudomonadota bacterium]
MDNLRVFLLISLALVGAMIYGQWQEDYSGDNRPEVSQAERGTREDADPQAPADDLPGRPPRTNSTDTQSVAPDEAEKPEGSNSQTVRVKTDVLDIEIATRGGSLVRSNLVEYTESLKSDRTIQLQSDRADRFFVIQSGLLSGDDQPAPDHHAEFSAEQTEYRLTGDSVTVPLVWESDNLRVTKRYTFYKNRYLFDLSYQIENLGDGEWSGHQYRQLQRAEYDENGSPFLVTYTGGVIYNQEDKYQKVDYDDMVESPVNQQFDQGWAAMIQHYFLTALVPKKDEVNHYYSRGVDSPMGERYVLGLTSSAIRVPAGETVTRSTDVFVGPKLQDRMEGVAEGLELTVDYGYLTVISKPLFTVLDWLHGWVGNWGWAIILLTALIKLVFFPLSQASYRSMAKMRQVAPKLQQIRERYADDRQRLSQEMMNLYKTEKINPVGSCLPMLIQIPVFIALYWALLESVELRQAPFILWINDLSTKDPFYVLPLIMGLTMYLQQKLNPTPPDPVQAKVFMMMPVVFTAFFAFFPSGLVLYWVTNNTLSIIQQWWITRQLEAEKGKG